MSASDVCPHLWLKAKPGRAAQRLRERRRRHKPESRREYRVRRAAGRTVRLQWNGMPSREGRG